MKESNRRVGGKKAALDRVYQPIDHVLGHNMSLGLRAEAEDSGPTAQLRSLVAPPQGGPVDFGSAGNLVDQLCEPF